MTDDLDALLQRAQQSKPCGCGTCRRTRDAATKVLAVVLWDLDKLFTLAACAAAKENATCEG